MVKIMSVIMCLAILNVVAALYKERLARRRCAKKYEKLQSLLRNIEK